MAGLLGLVKHVISSVMRRGGRGGGRGELRSVHARLRAIRPPLFRVRGRLLLAPLAFRLLETNRSLEPLRLIFRHSLSHEDAETAQRYRDWLVEARLPPSIEARRLSFTYKEIKRAIPPAGSVEKTLKQVGDQFRAYMECLAGETYAGFDAALNETLRLASLARFDFEHLLRRFDARFDPSRSDYRPRFSEVPGEEALDELLDLYFVTGALQLSDGVTRNLVYLASRLYRDEHFDPDGIARNVQGVRNALQQALPGPLLLDIIRAVREDATYVALADRNSEEYLAGYRRRVTEEYERDRERVAREASRAALDEDVKNLFPGGDLLTLAGYSDEESTLLLRRGLEGYQLVFPLRVLKSFAIAHYENRLMDIVRDLLEKGAFRQLSFQQALTSAAASCQAVRTRIEEFEAAFGDGGSFSSRSIHRSVDAHHRGKAALSMEMQRLVRSANKQARLILEESSNSYYRLGLLLGDAISDHRVKAPDKVVNIRVIDGDRNAAFMRGLVQGYSAIRRLQQIVRQYAVVQAPAAANPPLDAGPEEEPAPRGA